MYNNQLKIKYFIDKILALCLLILLFSLFLIIALLIKFDDKGSVLFKQKRLGFKGKIFTVYKFRTMIPDADNYLDGKGKVLANRITRVGHILRKTSLDELPQLINIIKGNMSFIGPRPALVDHIARYTEQQKMRFNIKPGITGLAQVHGRSKLSWSCRIKYDIIYVENYSLCLDIKILFKTFRVVMLREGIVLDRNPEQVDDLGSPILDAKYNKYNKEDRLN